MALTPVHAGMTPAARWEYRSWLFFRVSGLLLIVLALGHFAIMHAQHSILEVDYQFAARRWASPFWRAYDWTLLTLALLHGFNGLRVVAREHIHAPRARRLAQQAAVLLALLFIALGTYVVIAF